SSTFFIRDDDGNLAGMLCLNFDVSALSRARDTLDALVRVAPLQEPESDAWSDGVENLTGSVEDLMHAALNDILAHSRVRPNRMTAKEKMDIVRKLKEKGIFLLKSSVSVVASRLESSESTIYRYLSLIEQHERKGN
ncbi:MAG TPA: hypothetical protein GX716_07860, partial [Firmicutes bacterium]|nr:hypothetical protein [Candidatus Fermentithermobacillaceae bacterium]